MKFQEWISAHILCVCWLRR